MATRPSVEAWLEAGAKEKARIPDQRLGALAEALGMPLVTLDERLAKSKAPNCEFVTPRS